MDQDVPMASATFTVEKAEKLLHEEGFVDLHDSEVGGYISELEQKGFQYFSPYGLDFCQQRVLQDVRIRSILESLFEKCNLGHWLRYKELPGHIECFRKGGPEAGMRVVLVQLWARGSRVEYYRGSHLCVLPTTKGERSLHEIPRIALDDAGCKPNELDLPDGGLAVLDARIAFEIKSGYAITFIFATDEVVAAWPKITLPNSPEIVRKVVNMESTTIKVNFTVQASAGN